MIEIKKARGTERFFVKIDGLSKDMRGGIRKAYYRFGKRLQQQTKKDILRKPRSGEVYNIRTARRRRRHVASTAGEAPASITGRLWRSLDFLVSGSSSMRFGYDETAKSLKGFQYGKYWENKAPKNRRRPGLRINIDKNLGYGAKVFNREIKRALK